MIEALNSFKDVLACKVDCMSVNLDNLNENVERLESDSQEKFDSIISRISNLEQRSREINNEIPSLENESTLNNIIEPFDAIE